MQPNTASVQPGELLAGKYRVDRVIGEGGMGVVVAATNEALRQKVAIKLLRPGALENGEALGRFHREAHTAARLRSQHVAKVLDIGALPDGRPYMVMEMLEGQDLGDVIERGPPLSVAQAVDFVLQACEAIAEAHGAGIVHRDLKPKNLFLTTSVDGRPLVKVLDFGISKVEAGAADMQLTRTTEVIGSPSYMSPEQLRSARYVDARTDIWALGVILYELLTARLPFYAHTVTELVLVVATEQEKPIHTVRPDVPLALSEVITRCLAKKPEDRIQTVVELAAYLEPFAQVGSTTAAERVRGVALQSGRSLPSTGSHPSLPASQASGSGKTGPTSSARINVPGVHAGTSVAWGQTQAEPPRQVSGAPPAQPAPPPPAASRTTLIAVLAVAGVVLAAGLGGGAIFVMKRAAATTSTNAPPPAASEDLPLPPGRKDLPPIASAPPPASAAPSVTGEPSALPSTRTAPPPKPAGPAKPKPHTPTPPPDDLSNIGRR